VKKGRNAPVCPVLPEPDAGAVALAGIHINTDRRCPPERVLHQAAGRVRDRAQGPRRPGQPRVDPNTVAKLKAKKNVKHRVLRGQHHGRRRGQRLVQGPQPDVHVGVTAGIKAAYPGTTITETMAHQSGVSATAGGPTWQKYVMEPHNAGKTVDLAIIAMGMNDYGKPSLTPYKDALRGYIAQAKAAGIEVLLVTPIQSNPYYDVVNTVWVPRAQIAQAMREVAAETGVACADAFTRVMNQGSGASRR
jgi:lysophospholipase L1-like esterase